MAEVNITEVVGFIAAFLTTAAFLPQVYKTWKTKDVSSMSLPMFLMFFMGIVLWLVYGIIIESPSMILANGITVISSFLLVYLILKHRKKG
ncbi:SemiSWEET family sugar transporter [Aegicerativicinus sediminis]|uniref:SemiSWEET family sugar transporter n=1 Tax=Aegicerativicinus sediminis TaxID=2893202 RepID=UPI001E57549C|nr:SemiSWEET transporter [Aegicerativicinus sediminis]